MVRLNTAFTILCESREPLSEISNGNRLSCSLIKLNSNQDDNCHSIVAMRWHPVSTPESGRSEMTKIWGCFIRTGLRLASPREGVLSELAQVWPPKIPKNLQKALKKLLAHQEVSEIYMSNRIVSPSAGLFYPNLVRAFQDFGGVSCPSSDLRPTTTFRVLSRVVNSKQQIIVGWVYW